MKNVIRSIQLERIATKERTLALLRLKVEICKQILSERRKELALLKAMKALSE